MKSKAAKKEVIPSLSPKGSYSAAMPLANVRITFDDILKDPAYYTCVRVLSESIAATPLEIYDRATREKARDFYLYDILKYKPNDWNTPYEVFQWMMVDVLRAGYGIVFAPRDEDDRVAGLFPIPAKAVSLEATKSGELYYTYKDLPMPFEWVIKVSDIMVDNLLGSSILDFQKDTLSTAKATENFAAQSFAKGVFPSGFVIGADGVEGTEALKELKELFRQQFSGSANAGNVIISNAIKDFKQLNVSNEDAQMLESRKYNRSIIAGLMRVPAHLINDLEHATFSNVEHLDLAFVKHTLRPIAAKIQQKLALVLLTEEERKRYYIEYNFNDLMRGDLQSRVNALSQGINNGIYMPNEARGFENLPPVEGGNSLMINSSLKTLLSVVGGALDGVKSLAKKALKR